MLQFRLSGNRQPFFSCISGTGVAQLLIAAADLCSRESTCEDYH